MDRANLLVTVAAGMVWQIQSDIYIYLKNDDGMAGLVNAGS